MLRVLVVDDQPLARERVMTLLAAEPDVRVVGSCASGLDAVAAIRRECPDLVFLDMQMPELDGFAVIEAIGPEAMPATIFVTAYDQHAVRAFDVHALDYLLKPFGRARFAQALHRARRHLDRERSGEQAERLLALVRELRGATEPDRLIIRSDGRVRFVDIDQIDWVEAEGNYVRVHSAGSSHLMRCTLCDLLIRLGPDRFCRIHRSRIVQVDRIAELRYAAGGDYDVVLKDGQQLGMSRYCRDEIQARMAGRSHPDATAQTNEGR